MNTTTALIGYTGLVGSNLRLCHSFTAEYNSSNIETIHGQQFDLLVCAGASGTKWKANLEPDRDWAAIQRLLAALETVTAKTMVHVSSVDVFHTPRQVDEDSVVDLEGLHRYGQHRYRLEQFVRRRFPSASIVRLPGIFGENLKKNQIYDFLHRHELEKIHQDGVYQYYFLGRLWEDIGKVLDRALPLLHIATEPISVRELAREAFGMEFTNGLTTPPPRYDFRTKYSTLWGRSDGYLYSKAEVLEDIRAFARRNGI